MFANMRSHYPAGAACLSFLYVCVHSQIVASADVAAQTSELPAAHRSLGKHHAYAHPHSIIHPVSLQDCKREQLPAYLYSGGATDAEPVDFLLATAAGYKPYDMRAFLATFRKHNQAARVVMFVSPTQVRALIPTSGTQFLSRASKYSVAACIESMYGCRGFTGGASSGLSRLLCGVVAGNAPTPLRVRATL